MPKLFSSIFIVKILLENGFEFISQKGSHQKYRKVGNPTLNVIVPADRKVIPMGTSRSILRQANLTIDDFE